MRDYIFKEGLSEEKNELNIKLVAHVDPLSNGEAVKSSKWRQAMDAK
jgi:hypothetical protein